MIASDVGSEPAKTLPSIAMYQLIAGSWVARTIYVAAKLGLPDLLKDGPGSSAELALATRTHAPSLHRLLRALAAVGVVVEDERERFELTPLGAALRTDVPGSLRAWAEFALGEEASRSWEGLLHSVRTGEIAFDQAYGMAVWEHRKQNVEHARLFDAAMSNVSSVFNEAAMASYPFSEIKMLVDVGGGDGSLLYALLERNPLMCGILLDLPHVAEKAKQRLADANLSLRCEVVAGDMFRTVPSDADLYVLSRVIHDWADTEAVKILRNCRRVMREEARLILIERVLPAKIDASASTAMLFLPDLNMMVMNGGRERTEREFGSLLKASGLQLKRVIQTRSPMSVIEAACE